MSKFSKISFLFIAMILSLAALVFLLKPNNAELHQSNSSHPIVLKQNVSQLNPQTTTVEISSDTQKDEEFLEHRTRLYEFLGELSFDMIEGQKPDLRQVTDMMRLQNELVRQGLVEPQEALNYLEFLRQIFPEMETELVAFIEEINGEHDLKE